MKKFTNKQILKWNKKDKQNIVKWRENKGRALFWKNMNKLLTNLLNVY